MITGDKLETAEYIAISSGLIKSHWDLVVITQEHENIKNLLLRIRKDIKEYMNFALIIDGESLTHALKHKRQLYSILAQCKAVVIARANPRLKAEVISLIKKYERNAVTLAIGDGGNDVPMLQIAHIGVGIYGKEGHEAANSADFAIGQFKFLRDLLFVHGRWNLQRTGFFILFFFFKNLIFTLPQFHFALFSGFSGQTVWDDWYILNYNSLLTAFGVGLYGVFEQDINPRANKCFKQFMPKLYKETKEQEPLTLKKFFVWLGYGIYGSVIIFGFGAGCYKFSIMEGHGKTDGLWAMSVSMYTGVVFIVNTLLLLSINTWTWIHFVVVFLFGYFLYFPCFVFLYDLIPGTNVSFRFTEYISSFVFWGSVGLMVATVVIPYYVVKSETTLFRPLLVNRLRSGQVESRVCHQEDDKPWIMKERAIDSKYWSTTHNS